MSDREQLYEEFVKKFPLKDLQNLKLEKYTDLTVENHTRDDFTYWVETKAASLGGISVYPTDFGIYKHQHPANGNNYLHDDNYSWNKKYGNTLNEAWKKIRQLVYEVADYASQQKFSEIDKIDLSNQFKWKIAFLYSKKNITNIYKKDSLKLLLQKDNITFDENADFSELTQLVRTKCFQAEKDYWTNADTLWETCKTEANNIKKSKKSLLDTILEQLKERDDCEAFSYINNDSDFSKNNGGDFFWLGIKNSEIGDERCHYEIIVYNDKSVRSMIHFEEDSSKNGFKTVMKSLTEVVKPNYCRNEWYEICNSAVSIATNDLDTIVNKTIENLINLDEIVRHLVIEELDKLRGMKMSEKISYYVELLKHTKNLILTGAPGTGKTFLAKQIAEKIVGEGNKSKICFTQFHQSYDYTDFVEGLRPVKKQGSEMEFKCIDGLFKDFCKGALKNINDSEKDEKEVSLENAITNEYRQLCEEIRETGETNISLKTEGKFVRLSDCNDDSTVLYVKPTNSEIHEYSISLDKMLQLSRKYQTLQAVENAKPAEFTEYVPGLQSYGWAVLHELYQRLSKKKKMKDDLQKVKRQDFVFIIDEINRGEMSKIFGELFYAIDPTCRITVDNLRKRDFEAIRTQYSNMNEESNIFDSFIEGAEKDRKYGHFFVPENVYIIGTMNDIDRGVESIDFAFRRRFAWEEVKADDTKDEILNHIMPEEKYHINQKNLTTLMDKLNNKIEKIEGLSSAYHLGAAYFLKIRDYVDISDDDTSPYQKLWNYNLKPLLREYMRGMEDSPLNELETLYYDVVRNFSDSSQS